MDDGQRLLAPAPPELPDETDELDALAELLLAGTGVIIAGGGVVEREPVLALAALLGWPVLADQRSGCRIEHPCTVTYGDALLRTPELVSALSPSMVLRLGAPLASKALSQWLASLTVPQIGVDAHGTLWDPEQVTVATIGIEPGVLAGLLAPRLEGRGDGLASPWLARWQDADRTAGEAIDAVLAQQPTVSEPAVARDLLAALPGGAHLVVSSSMPIRDLEWFGLPRDGVTVLANRGANGIDGVTSTAVGVAIGSGGPTVALLGDLAFLHDAGGLLGIAARGVDLVLVVVDNDGGGIFSFLPQADAMAATEFEELFATPQGIDLCRLGEVHGLEPHRVALRDHLVAAVDAALHAGGVHLLVVDVPDRSSNRELHAALARAASAAVAAVIGADEGTQDR